MLKLAQHAVQIARAHNLVLVLAALLLLGVLLIYLVFFTSALRRTGVIVGLFFAGYGFVRFLVELVRQPDSFFQSPNNPIEYALQLGDWGLTMGQILSLPMIILGLWILWRAEAATGKRT